MKINLESFLSVNLDLLDAPKVDQKTVKFRKSFLSVNLDLLDASKLVSFFENESRLQSTKLGRLLA